MTDTEELYSAIEADDADRIAQLLTTRPGLVNSVEETPPPIHWAIYRDKRKAVKALLDSGAGLALRDQDRDATPIDYAVVYGRRELIRLLIAHGASLDAAMDVARKGASGGFEEFQELPSAEQYKGIVELLREIGSA
ncbi:MAG: ankyrin repeat domain-containing protein [Gammaproteobacteria bacterium]|nr:ankyrin repeat domain-containing protein [Gammaproteobacteria bacterium]